MKNSYFIAGISIFAIMLGLLIGASSTPIAGVFITGIFGSLLGVASLFYKGVNNEKESDSNSTSLKRNYQKIISTGKATGLALAFFSIAIVIGIYLGSMYRRSIYNVNAEIIWTKDTKPKSTYEALDWITVTQILQQRGYSISQIKEIYKIRINEIDADTDFEYDPRLPYTKMLFSGGAAEENNHLEGLDVLPTVRNPVYTR